MEITQQQIDTTFVFRFLKGENIIESLKKFFKEHPMYKGASVKGIGAVSYVKLGYFNGIEYEQKEYKEDLEILNLLGNVSYNLENELIVHMHGIFGNNECICVGGHVFEATVSVTCEMIVTILKPGLNRSLDDKTGLQLLNLSKE